MSDGTETQHLCEHWLHRMREAPNASHYNTRTREWACYPCVQAKNREEMQRARKFGAKFTNPYMTAEEYLFSLLLK